MTSQQQRALSHTPQSSSGYSVPVEEALSQICALFAEQIRQQQQMMQ